MGIFEIIKISVHVIHAVTKMINTPNNETSGNEKKATLPKEKAEQKEGS